MVCKKCGTVVDDTAVICPVCGETMENTATAATEPVVIAQPKKFSGMAIAGFVISLVGLLVLALPCGILGIVFSAIGLNKTLTPVYRGKGLAISGLIIAIIDTVFGLVNIMLL